MTKEEKAKLVAYRTLLMLGITDEDIKKANPLLYEEIQKLLKDENITDTLLDLAIYSLIAIILFEERITG